MTAQTRIVELPPDGLTEDLLIRFGWFHLRETDEVWLMSKTYVNGGGWQPLPSKPFLEKKGFTILRETPLGYQAIPPKECSRKVHCGQIARNKSITTSSI